MTIQYTGRSGRPFQYQAVTPSDVTLLLDEVGAILVTVTGNVAVVMKNASTATFLAVPAYTIIEGDIRQVLSTGTTASGIFAVLISK